MRLKLSLLVSCKTRAHETVFRATQQLKRIAVDKAVPRRQVMTISEDQMKATCTLQKEGDQSESKQQHVGKIGMRKLSIDRGTLHKINSVQKTAQSGSCIIIKKSAMIS